MILRLGVALVAATLVLSLAVAGVGAQSDSPEWERPLFEQFRSQAGLFNDNVDDANLGPAGSQLAGHRVNFYVTDGDQQAVYSFYMDENNHVTDLQVGAHPDASLKMTADRPTVVRVLTSQTPATEFRRAVLDGDIVVAGERGHLVEQVTWTVINVAKGLLF